MFWIVSFISKLNCSSISKSWYNMLTLNKWRQIVEKMHACHVYGSNYNYNAKQILYTQEKTETNVGGII